MDAVAIRTRVAPHLPAGEAYVTAFQAMGGMSPHVPTRWRVVALTDRRIHLFSARWWRVCEPRRLLASLPPGTVVPVKTSRLVYDEIVIAGETLWVPLAYHELLTEAIVHGAFVRQ